jgi:hypothetical protein
MLQLKHQFRSSINLQLDMKDERLLNQYILSPSHSEVFRGVVESVLFGGTRSHLLIGPYGTGKTFVATILCQLLSKQFSSNWRTSLLSQAERIDPKLAESLRAVENLNLQYIPVVINGKTGSIRTIIGRALYRIMKQEGIDITLPNEVSFILNTVDRWEKLYPSTFALLIENISKNQLTWDEWITRVENGDEEVIKRFIEFYPTVTSGTPWAIEHEDYFIENIDHLTRKLAERGKGILIVYDEFGRFLQTLEGSDALRNMQDLQDLAEYSNHTENMQLLLVGHRYIRHYAVNSRESIRTEFEKVEKRFRSYTLENDNATYLLLAQQAAADINALSLTKTGNLESLETLQRFPLFSEYTTYQLDQNILKSLYPLHPVGVAILPELSNIFGQNERTLFSFFTDYSRHSIREHVEHDQGYYYVDKLFHFFELAKAETWDQPSLTLYHIVEPFIDKRDPIQSRIVELITLWSVVRFTQRQPLTTEFISFALGIPAELVENALNQLAAAKVSRFNQIRNQWELFDGSSVDLEAVIQDRLATITLESESLISILEQHMPYSYVLPYEYNESVDMIRYADLHFVEASALTDQEKLATFDADDLVFFAVFTEEQQLHEFFETSGQLNHSHIIAVPTFTIESIQPSLKRFYAVKRLLTDTEFLSLDSRIKNELQYLLQETSVKISTFVERYFNYKELHWWVSGERRQINNLQGLEQLITERMHAKFHRTLTIRNEAFNRKRISAIQRRALIDVIDRLIAQPSEPQLGIQGYGPNYLIYVSVLKNNDYAYDQDGRISCNAALRELQNDLKEMLHHQPVGRLSDLIRIFKDEPYGIRNPVIPLLFVALLRDVWNQLMFYAHDMLTSHLSGAAIIEMIENSTNYEYRFYDMTREEKQLLLRIGDIFSFPSEASSSFVHMSEALLRWLRTLPKFTLITDQVSEQTRKIRAAIRSSEVDPFKHMRNLLTMVDDIEAAKQELECFIQSNEIELESQLCKIVTKPSINDFLSEIKKHKIELIGSNSKLATVPDDLEISPIDRLVEHLIGVSRTEWSDATQELFIKQFQYEWQLMKAPTITEAQIEFEMDTPIELSKKATVVYTNVKNLLKYAGRDLTTLEIRHLLMKIMQEYDA